MTKIFISVSAGVSEARWSKMSSSEKKAYIEKYPNSKYAKASKKPAGAKSVVKADIPFTASKTKEAVKEAFNQINKASGAGCKLVKITWLPKDRHFEATVSAPSKEAMKKFQDAYHGD